MRYLIFMFLITFNSYSQTVVKKDKEGWSLLVNEKPFIIKGVTFGYDNDIENYDTYFKDLKFLGVNTIRTWATGENSLKLLDAANKHGLKVMLGIWMRHGRPGMEDDDSFDYLNDNEGMEAMYENAIQTVKTYKDHPAILTWGVGNEVYLNTETDKEKLAYSKLLERICSKIKSLDTNHPITSVEAWTFGLDWWRDYVPSIDIYGLNSYGYGANYLEDELKKHQIDKPYIVTEYGVTGEWDIKNHKNGIKIEPLDTEKYDAIAIGYKDWIANKTSCLGVYVFHYGSGNDFAAPWLFTHVDKMYRPQYWAIREAYTGIKPLNNIPEIKIFKLPESKYQSGTWVAVDLKVSDVENDKLNVKFSYNQRTGSRKRRNQIIPLKSRGNLSDGFEIQLPPEDGAIKVYVNVKDSYNNLGIASNSILVKDKDAKARKYLVPKVELPFFVFKDNEDLPYQPSGYMGNYKDMEVDLNSTEDPYSGETSIRISYNSPSDWYGIAFVDPANDWGDILGGYDLSGAKTFSFWAKANFDDVTATIGFGLIDDDKPFPDTAKESIEIDLTNEWKKYSIKVKKLDLSCIRSGLVLFANGNGYPYKIFIDNVVFE
ncbi:glycoside hydrolase family 2 TIM barrel-domain containing protein [Winogradskyella forsetii]|uniref:glycoside hydrolase family 2 TIM barrel-domain containing protein n=1 Tax=Winogradskyella forsetii TaxID=2686077 RepID=UPI0015BB824F|nr:glycoside hydrolase family 2 TIM barrel-domain containing protein [Winogradskyella forsetii]